MDPATIQMLLQGIVDTLYMTAVATLLAYIIGLPLGVIQVVTAKDGIKPNRFVYTVLNVITNIARSIPFLIFLVAILPLPGPLTEPASAPRRPSFPWWWRPLLSLPALVESSIKEIDPGVVEAAQSMGASPMPDHHPCHAARGPSLNFSGQRHRHHHHSGIFLHGGLCGRAADWGISPSDLATTAMTTPSCSSPWPFWSSSSRFSRKSACGLQPKATGGNDCPAGGIIL